MSTCSVFIGHKGHSFGILLARSVFEWWLYVDASHTASKTNFPPSLYFFWGTYWGKLLSQGWDMPTHARESSEQSFCEENWANCGYLQETSIASLRHWQILSADCTPSAKLTIWAEQQVHCPSSPSKNTHALSRSQQFSPFSATLSLDSSYWLRFRFLLVTTIVSFSWVCNTNQRVCSSIRLQKCCKDSRLNRIRSEGNATSILLLHNGSSKVYTSLLFHRKEHRIWSEELVKVGVSQKTI